MKISPITSYKPNFGYDKRLNKELKTELENHSDKTMAATISSLNDYCNLVENNLRKLERSKKGTASTSYHDYQDMLSTSKQLLAGFVSITFPQLNFPDREYKHYDVQFVKRGSNQSDWRVEVMDALSEWTENVQVKKKVAKPKNPKDIPYVPKFDENGVEITDNPKDKLIDKLSSVLSGNKSDKSLLERFVPTALSPKGFSDVAGMDKLKQELSEGIIQLINNPEQAKLDYEEYGKSTPKAVLLYGPPGCGKTYITQALASEIDSPMYMLNISNAGSEFINLTSKNLKSAFKEAVKISEDQQKPVLVFMDEIDSLGFDRGAKTWPEDIKQVATMLQCIDDVKKSNVIIMGATNKYDILDPAIRRRFDKKVFVDIPDKLAIQSLLVKELSPMAKAQKLLSSDEDLKTISDKLYGYSNSSICIITKEAALNALHRDRADISVQDFDKAIQETGEEKPDKKLFMADSKKNTNKMGFGT